MALIDHLLSAPRIRQVLWKFWYPYVTRRLRDEGVLFLNYAFETEPPMRVALAPEDEPDRPCIQLYHHVATQTSLQNQDVLEVSCGHGGGASYLVRTLKPRAYTAIDLNPVGIGFCRERHRLPDLEFLEGNAQRLPFADASFDVVINVEASHCYPSFTVFLQEVARVLRPGGRFVYADFRFRSGIPEWESAIASAPLTVRTMQHINAEVLRGLDLNSARSLRLIEGRLPRFLHALGRDFAAVKGSRVYRAFETGEISYRSYQFEKPAPPR